MELLKKTIYPSDQKTIYVSNTEDEYGGAHSYSVKYAAKFNEQTKQIDYNLGKAVKLDFLKKNEDGSWNEGLQSEQLLLVLINRHEKLNAKFPSKDGSRAITHMKKALWYLEKRTKEREGRKVVGELKK